MPNWCDNAVTISNDDKAKIDELEKVLTDKDNQQVFNTLRPRPETEEDNWYDWNCNNWGTKWEMTVIDWERYDDNEIWISFESAWSPPVPLYDYLVQQGWGISAVYNEPGCAYGGLYTTDGGDDYYEYDITDLESIEALPSDIVEFGDLIGAHEYFKENEDETEVD